jgi:hypothetical protein
VSGASSAEGWTDAREAANRFRFSSASFAAFSFSFLFSSLSCLALALARSLAVSGPYVVQRTNRKEDRRGRPDLFLFVLPSLLSLLLSQLPALFFGFLFLFSQLIVLRDLDFQPLLKEESCQREREGWCEAEGGEREDGPG